MNWYRLKEGNLNQILQRYNKKKRSQNISQREWPKMMYNSRRNCRSNADGLVQGKVGEGTIV